MIQYLTQYADEDDLPLIMRLVDNELSEPYSIFTYRQELNRTGVIYILGVTKAYNATTQRPMLLRAPVQRQRSTASFKCC